jgi:RNA polymerase sigma-70 factor, ECF subfamily
VRPFTSVVIAETLSLAPSVDPKELYRNHYPRLYRFALAFSGSEALAAEAVQEAFLDLLRSPGIVDPARGSAVALLYGMVRNRLRRSRRVEREEPLETDEAADEDLLVDLVRAERVEAVRAAIASLPEHYREVVLLCEIEECSYEDAAAAIGVPLGTVRSRLSRAKVQLRARLKEFVHETR